jgi:hypothetical protein
MIVLRPMPLMPFHQPERRHDAKRHGNQDEDAGNPEGADDHVGEGRLIGWRLDKSNYGRWDVLESESHR